MGFSTFDVSITDEIKGIPCGRRIVEAEVGRKWARVRLPGRTAHRIPKSVWQRLGALPVVVRKRRRKAVH